LGVLLNIFFPLTTKKRKDFIEATKYTGSNMKEYSPRRMMSFIPYPPIFVSLEYLHQHSEP
jgi:hypothetical protein